MTLNVSSAQFYRRGGGITITLNKNFDLIRRIYFNYFSRIDNKEWYTLTSNVAWHHLLHNKHNKPNASR